MSLPELSWREGLHVESGHFIVSPIQVLEIRGPGSSELGSESRHDFITHPCFAVDDHALQLLFLELVLLVVLEGVRVEVGVELPRIGL